MVTPGSGTIFLLKNHRLKQLAQGSVYSMSSSMEPSEFCHVTQSVNERKIIFDMLDHCPTPSICPVRGLSIFAVVSQLCFASTALSQSTIIDYETPPPADVQDAVKDALPKSDAPKTALAARRQAKRAKTITLDTLNSYGYFAPTISIMVGENEESPAPKLRIDTGPLFTLSRAELNYLETPPKADDVLKLQDALPVKIGQPAVPGEIIDAERILGVELRNLGYAFGEVKERDIIGDKEAGTIGVRYNISSGPRVEFGEVIFPDNVRTRASYLKRLDPTDKGAVFDPAQLALYNSRLSETRLFDSSVARLSTDPVGVSPNGNAIYDIILDLDERDRHTVALGASFGTNEGFGVNSTLTRRNATRRGDLLIADISLAQRELGLDLVWRRPNELGYGKGLILTAELKDENTDAFDQQLANLGAGYEVISGPRLSYNFGVRGQYTRETIEQDITPERAEDSEEPPIIVSSQQDFQTLSTYAGVAIDRSDSVLDPRKGWRAEGRVVPTYAFSDTGNRPYLRSVIQGRAYLPLDAKARFVAAGRLRAGTLVGASASDVPSETRFYAGGGGSVRGYGYQAIGPFDSVDEDLPLGGRSLLDGSLEARWRYNDKIGVVGFVDAGNVSDAQYPRFDNLRVGAGVGVRYNTPAGPLRLDVAMPLNPSDRDEDFQLYISIGQAF